MREKSVGTINECQKKFDDLRIIAGNSYRHIIKEAYGDDPKTPKGLEGRFPKWLNNGTPPDDSVELFDKLAIRYFERGTTGRELIRCDYATWLERMTIETRAFLRGSGDHPTYMSFLIDLDTHKGNLEAKWISDEVVDQRYMYMYRDSVDFWNEIADEHPLFKNCEHVLHDFLLHDKSWKALFKDKKLGSVVILGAGAPSKDIAILNDILKRQGETPSRFKYIVFDGSFFMLVDTAQRIMSFLTRKKAASVVQFIPCCADFMKLRSWRDCIRPTNADKSAVFFILGHTLGNVDEVALFDAIKDVSEPGDLFIISEDLINESDVSGYRESVKAMYDKDEVRDLVLVPVREMLNKKLSDRKKYPPHAEDRRKLVDVPPLAETTTLPPRVRSRIPRTIAVVFRLNVLIDHVSLVLGVSKRHHESELKDAVVESKHFKFLEARLTPEYSDTHKFLVFERQSDPD